MISSCCLYVCMFALPVVATQCPGKHFPAATNTHATIEELLDAVFSVRVTLRPTTSRSVRLGVEPHLGIMTKYNYYLTITVLSMSGAPSDVRSGLSFVLVT
jgi:hypothetical protein